MDLALGREDRFPYRPGLARLLLPGFKFECLRCSECGLSSPTFERPVWARSGRTPQNAEWLLQTDSSHSRVAMDRQLATTKRNLRCSHLLLYSGHSELVHLASAIYGRNTAITVIWISTNGGLGRLVAASGRCLANSYDRLVAVIHAHQPVVRSYGEG